MEVYEASDLGGHCLASKIEVSADIVIEGGALAKVAVKVKVDVGWALQRRRLGRAALHRHRTPEGEMRAGGTRGRTLQIHFRPSAIRDRLPVRESWPPRADESRVAALVACTLRVAPADCNRIPPLINK
ncbi:hypothetical protein MSG28_003409 [Choristoneura fumiferana]|uniref:Uncharacterized protein n=1 Tax=Choristoneura fumiferana TaxID=7141 RepID=A0ACC0KFP0_CHOFU|nr:hypothetical protein MSG28_003409 [Choristoneura fumiferana]